MWVILLIFGGFLGILGWFLAFFAENCDLFKG